MYTGKYKVGYDLIIAALNSNPTLGRKDLIKLAFKDYKYSDKEIDSLRKYFDRYLKSIKDEHEGIYRTSAAVDVSPSDAKHMWIKKKLEDGTSVSTFVKNPNFVDPHTEEDDGASYEDIKALLEKELKDIIKFKTKVIEGHDVGVVVIADLHLGAYIDGLVNTRDYSIPILIEYFGEIVDKVNRMNYKEVHVLFLGDMIESFTGLNHKNSWKGLQKGMIGAEVIKFSVNVLHEKLLSKINNLKDVKLVAGNHDRLTSDKAEDTDGGACDLIAFGLELRGYNVEFHPTVISVEIDGINYIILHGHKGISRKPTKDLCWDFGKKGMYNVILEGHLHSIIQKLSVNLKGKFNIIKDDSVDHIRMNARSLFTGNGFSEDLGYTSNAGFSIITNNGKGLPNINNILL
jgi:UDP-2,3-diacylglucosamine pyrophosphatase LpxH